MNYTIPTSWKEVNLRQYIDLMNLSPEITGIEKTFKINSILLEISPRDVKKIPAADFASIQEKLSFTSTPPGTRFDSRVFLKDQEYGIIPNLENLTIGEFIDIEEYAADWNNKVHLLMAVLYRPIIEKGNWGYTIEEYDSEKSTRRADLFLDYFNVEDAQSASVFFSLIVSGYLSLSPESLVN